MISVDEYKEESNLVFITKSGIIKRTAVKEFESIRQTGKIAITLKENDELFGVKLTSGQDEILIAADTGKVIKFEEDQVRLMGRSASGVKGIELVEGAEAISLTTSAEGDKVLVISEKGYGKISPLEEYRLTSRGTKGVITMNMTEKTGNIIATKAVNGDEDVMVITKGGIVIRTWLNEVKVAGRNTQGVKIINIKEKESVVSLTIVPHVEESEEVVTVETPTEAVVEEVVTPDALEEN